jgi:hypothetical protein
MMRAGEFASFVRFLALCKGSVTNATQMAIGHGAKPNVVEAFKAAVAAGGTGTAGSWGQELAAVSLLMSSFQDQLRFSSAFMRMWADGAVTRLPFEVVVGAISGSADGTILQPGAAIPVSKMNITSATLERQKAAGLLVLSEELLKQQREAEALITRQLRASVGKAVDKQVFTDLLVGVTAITSQGLLTDVRSLLEAVDPTTESRLYFVASPNVAILMATSHTNGVRWFPATTAVGGEVVGVPVLVSDAIDTGYLLLVDAARLGGNADVPVVEASRQAALQMDSAPTMSAGSGSPNVPTETNTVSMWATNSVAIRAIAFFGVTRVRPNAVASVFTGGSP